MLNFSRTKIITILAICFLALFYAIPSFISPSFFEKNPALTKFLPSQKVNLGLDLRGGSQLMMEVDFDYYIKEQLNNLKEELKSTKNTQLNSPVRTTTQVSTRSNSVKTLTAPSRHRKHRVDDSDADDDYSD